MRPLLQLAPSTGEAQLLLAAHPCGPVDSEADAVVDVVVGIVAVVAVGVAVHHN